MCSATAETKTHVTDNMQYFSTGVMWCLEQLEYLRDDYLMLNLSEARTDMFKELMFHITTHIKNKLETLQQLEQHQFEPKEDYPDYDYGF